MQLEFLVEEPSAQITLINILPKIIGSRAVWNIRVFQGYQDLLKKLPQRLKGYFRRSNNDLIIIVLLDTDSRDCHQFKNILEQIAISQGLKTKSTAQTNEKYHIINRLIIRELEAWFFGDASAVRAAYPRASKNFERNSKYHDPDSINRPSEALKRVLGRYYSKFLPKTEVAKKISPFMEPIRNRSKSFQIFRDTFGEILS